ncbi:MAG: hypothetical protein JST01_29340 [Cyanobacteria bacterium SZAS TMP-1]|nr:hypothetical protein [Cyanobacteria bacterium SZAS TMP-1]
MKNVLVIEDWQPIARAIKALLEAAGHHVTWLVGANSFQTVATTGQTRGGVILSGLTADGQTVEVDCRQYQAAFVDGQLEGKIEGPALVELLVASQVACCGMSTQSDMNKQMIALGAKLAAKKPVVFAALLSRRLSADSVINPTRTQVTQLSNLETRFMSPEFQDLRHEADQQIMAIISASGH